MCSQPPMPTETASPSAAGPGRSSLGLGRGRSEPRPRAASRSRATKECCTGTGRGCSAWGTRGASTIRCTQRRAEPVAGDLWQAAAAAGVNRHRFVVASRSGVAFFVVSRFFGLLMRAPPVHMLLSLPSCTPPCVLASSAAFSLGRAPPAAPSTKPRREHNTPLVGGKVQEEQPQPGRPDPPARS